MPGKWWIEITIRVVTDILLRKCSFRIVFMPGRVKEHMDSRLVPKGVVVSIV